MATCRVCTASITWGVDEAGVKIPLDDHEQLDYGPRRYRIVADGSVPRVAAVAEDSTARTFVDHRQLCMQPRVV